MVLRSKASIGRLLLGYLSACRLTLLGYLGFHLVFLVIAVLYRLPSEPIVYAFELSSAAGLVLGGIGFSKHVRRHRLLVRLQSGIHTTIDGLPEAAGVLESDYQELITALYGELSQVISRNDRHQTETTDYHTLWTHQIKTPIAAMRLLLQSDGQRADLEQELFKIERYVELVLNYLRLNSLASDLVIEEINLAGIIRQTVRKYATVFIHNNLSLDVGAIDLSIVTDKKWLAFVLEQILSNALKYTKKGAISIGLDPEDRRILVIEDTGMGIRAEDIPRLFERGFTGFNGRTGSGNQSTGLGLYLCRQISNQLSYPITIASEIGKGTKVRIDFGNLAKM